MFNLDEDQKDILLEVFNVGMGYAAAALSDLSDETVDFNVSSLQIVNGESEKMPISSLEQQRAGIVSQKFSGTLDGKTLLAFPEGDTMTLIRLFLKQDLPLNELTDLESEAMCEIGNIILNAAMATVANMIGGELVSSLPQYHHGTLSGEKGALNDVDCVLLLQINFGLHNRAMNGLVLLVLSLQSIQKIIDSILSQVPGAALLQAGKNS